MEGQRAFGERAEELIMSLVPLAAENSLTGDQVQALLAYKDSLERAIEQQLAVKRQARATKLRLARRLVILNAVASSTRTPAGPLSAEPATAESDGESREAYFLSYEAMNSLYETDCLGLLDYVQWLLVILDKVSS
ncbi:MAG: hypothetical protein KDD62_16405 [Bdellovibrionales bacterium]|nr:hypothetical protein [Bdellovibrionales bacterium]